jgi:hypothetical protein
MAGSSSATMWLICMYLRTQSADIEASRLTRPSARRSGPASPGRSGSFLPAVSLCVRSLVQYAAARAAKSVSHSSFTGSFYFLAGLAATRCYSPMIFTSTRLRRRPSNSP